MIPYTELKIEIGYIGGKSIRIRSKTFPTHLASNQSNWHNLASEKECKEQVDLSEQQEVDIESG